MSVVTDLPALAMAFIIGLLFGACFALVWAEQRRDHPRDQLPDADETSVHGS